MMMYIDNPSRCRKDRIDRRAQTRAASYKDSHQGVQRGRSVMTPEGHPARSDPGQIVGPTKAVVLIRRTRAYFIKARTPVCPLRGRIYRRSPIFKWCIA